jgi:hypothetical protein
VFIVVSFVASRQEIGTTTFETAMLLRNREGIAPAHRSNLGSDANVRLRGCCQRISVEPAADDIVPEDIPFGLSRQRCLRDLPPCGRTRAELKANCPHDPEQ